MSSSTGKADLPVLDQLKTGSVLVKTSVPSTKVDVSGGGVSMSLGQVSATSTTNTSKPGFDPATGTGHDISPDQELSEDESPRSVRQGLLG